MSALIQCLQTEMNVTIPNVSRLQRLPDQREWHCRLDQCIKDQPLIQNSERNEIPNANDNLRLSCKPNGRHKETWRDDTWAQMAPITPSSVVHLRSDMAAASLYSMKWGQSSTSTSIVGSSMVSGMGRAMIGNSSIRAQLMPVTGAEQRLPLPARLSCSDLTTS